MYHPGQGGGRRYGDQLDMFCCRIPQQPHMISLFLGQRGSVGVLQRSFWLRRLVVEVLVAASVSTPGSNSLLLPKRLRV